jgi:hypothetical protein
MSRDTGPDESLFATPSGQCTWRERYSRRSDSEEHAMAEEKFAHLIFVGGGVKGVGLAGAAPKQRGRGHHEPKAPHRATQAPPTPRCTSSRSRRSVAGGPARRAGAPEGSGVRVGPSAGAGPIGRGERAKRATEGPAQRGGRRRPRRRQHHGQIRPTLPRCRRIRCLDPVETGCRTRARRTRTRTCAVLPRRAPRP